MSCDKCDKSKMCCIIAPDKINPIMYFCLNHMNEWIDDDLIKRKNDT